MLAKRLKCEPSWISATQTRNFLLNDHLTDWLKTYRSFSATPKSAFAKFICEQGNKFEANVIENLKQKFNLVSILPNDFRITEEACKRTKEAMQQGVALIHAAPFKNEINYTRGIIDLLVRSDMLGSLTKMTRYNSRLMHFKAPKLSGNYHYVALDIKFCTLALRSDGVHLLNSDNFPAYKGQLYTYTQALEELQGYTPRFAYVLGRRWRTTVRGETYHGTNCFDRLGTIDYQGADEEFVTKTEDARTWIRDVQKYGKDWNPGSRSELYPNMAVDAYEFQAEKERIAKELGEITMLWKCGISHREKALAKRVKSWKDRRLCAETMGIKGEIQGPTVDAIIRANRDGKCTGVSLPKGTAREVFVDFETFPDIFCTDVPESKKTDTIFMIGIYYLPICATRGKNEIQQEYVYTHFTVKDLSLEEEYRIMNEFAEFVKMLGNPILWYWSAEQRFWSSGEERHYKRLEGTPEAEKIVEDWCLKNQWVDLCTILRENKVALPGAFGFGLKEIALALYNRGVIKTNLDTEVNNGQDASIIAYNRYKELGTVSPYTDAVINEIAKYNHFDVKVLQEILQYYRN